MTKLYVVSHKKVYIPGSSVLIPINPDDAAGNSIPEKSGYSELRAHYRVWKNEPHETDVVGFFQFRRYLDLNATAFTDFASSKRPVPYKTRKLPTAESYSDKALEALSGFDIIAPVREYTGISVWERYAEAPGQRASDLRLAYEIIANKHPAYLDAADSYLNGNGEYYGNLYIMRRAVFDTYCSWLFGILGEFDLRCEEIPPRTQGYLAERLFGIWFTMAVSEGSLRCAELPRVHFWGYDDESHHLRRDKLINALLPPGTRFRANIRRLIKQKLQAFRAEIKTRGGGVMSALTAGNIKPDVGQYDFLLVGAGLYGAVFAHEAVKCGKKCLVIDRRSHIGGNVYTENIAGINVHRYGAHIFHTSDKRIWDYVTELSEFNNYINSPVAIFENELYNLPFNMNTFNRLWGVKAPAEAEAVIREQIKDLKLEKPHNLEEQALSMVGRDVYEKLIKGYTEKQWGRPCAELPPSIIKRLPLRFTYNNNYFNDKYQGIPIGGYTPMIEKLLEGADVLTDTAFADFINGRPGLARKTVYTGPIDEYFGYSLGHLEYRSLRFESEELPERNHQGCAVINYTSAEVPYTRVIEHKHFEFGEQPTTVITREYPCEWQPGAEPYYPINDEKNNLLFDKYRALSDREPNVIFGGRLGEYKYYDMDKVIASALLAAEKELAF